MCFSRRRRTPGTPPRRLHGIRRRARTAADRCGEGGALKPLWLRAVVGSRVSRALLAVSMSRLSRFKSLVPLHLTHGSNPVFLNLIPWPRCGQTWRAPPVRAPAGRGAFARAIAALLRALHGMYRMVVERCASPRSTWTVVGGGPAAALSTSSWTQHAPPVVEV